MALQRLVRPAEDRGVFVAKEEYCLEAKKYSLWYPVREKTELAPNYWRKVDERQAG